MYDIEIRNILHSHLIEQNKKFKDSIIVDELNIKNGLARVDVAVVNGIIHGYEIKSESDSLVRLENQIKHYSSSLEKVSIVINPIHTEKIIKKVPNWWGVIEVSRIGELDEIREAEENIALDITDTLLLLWKDELIGIIEKHQIIFKKSYNRQSLIQIIVKNLAKDDILVEIRHFLKSRKNWRN